VIEKLIGNDRRATYFPFKIIPALPFSHILLRTQNHFESSQKIPHGALTKQTSFERSKFFKVVVVGKKKKTHTHKLIGLCSLGSVSCLLTLLCFFYLFVCFWRDSPQWARASSFTRILDYTQRNPQAVGLIWKSDQLVAETTTSQHTQKSQHKNIHAPGEIRTHNLSRRAAADLDLRPLGQ
jgi:hypothetical protein